ncbi:MAG: fatty acid desaturase, partial [Cyanobacteria bacterium J06626_26]
LCHDISVHVPHHISTGIPSYNLRMAHQSLKDSWGDRVRIREEKFTWNFMRNIVDRCHLYHAENAYVSFGSLRRSR